LYELGILVDTDGHYANPNLLDRYLMQPSILRAFGWRFALVLTKDWYHNREEVLNRIEKLLKGEAVEEEPVEQEEAPEVEHLEAKGPEIGAADKAPLKPEPQSGTLVEPPPSPVAKAAAGTVRHFEFVAGSLRKFWEISQSGNSFTVRFGRIGTAGQSQTKTFADEARAKRETEALIGEKLKKGYVEKG
jgi:predicted DNA-binding WGR domain protein